MFKARGRSCIVALVHLTTGAGNHSWRGAGGLGRGGWRLGPGPQRGWRLARVLPGSVGISGGLHCGCPPLGWAGKVVASRQMNTQDLKLKRIA